MTYNRFWYPIIGFFFLFLFVLQGCDTESRDITLFLENGDSVILHLDFWTLKSIWN
jgi:hypothetical protein